MKLTTRDITEIAVMTALISVTSWISIPIGPVPVTLQTFMVMLIGLVLSTRNATISMIAYLLIGAIGLPVFAGGTSGIGVIFGPTGGFLISFLVAATFVSFMKNIKFINNDFLNILLVVIMANAIIYMIGWTYYGIYTSTGLKPTLGIAWLFVPGDLVKIIVVSYAYLNIRSYVTYERA